MEEESISLFDLDLRIDDAAGSYLRDTAKWARVVSVFFIVFTGFMLLFLMVLLMFRTTMIAEWTRGGIYFPGLTSTGEGMYNVMLAIVLFFAALLSIFTVLLFRFSHKTKKAILANDPLLLESGVSSLKTYMIITGIMTLVLVLNGLYQFINIFI